MNIHDASAAYEAWLGRYMRLVGADLDRKHQRMTEGAFPFFRATFYRWCQRWRELATGERGATKVLSVGDVHVENFGTWRDADGRLVWGANDFDEPAILPWSHDLVRLAASVHVAIADGLLALRRRDVSEALLAGYEEGLVAGGRPFVLEEENGWLRRLATSELRHPTEFWRTLSALRPARAADASAVEALRRALPAPKLDATICRRVAGVGSLGRPRFVAIAAWCGGKIAREAKAIAPSAWRWSLGQAPARAETLAPRLLARAARASDPTVGVDGAWSIRRLAPHCTHIELSDLPRERDEERLIRAMGAELANVHLGTPGARDEVRRELRARRRGWLDELARALTDAVAADWRDWRRG
jgi:hypothetical protein